MSLDVPMLEMRPSRPVQQLRAVVGSRGARVVVAMLAAVPVVLVALGHHWLDAAGALDRNRNTGLVVIELAVLALIGLLPLAWLSSAPSDRLGFDGERVTSWHRPLVRREIARVGAGRVLRATIHGTLGMRGPQQFWLDEGGRERGRFAEHAWGEDELRRLAGYARIPIIEVGDTTLPELYRAHAAMASPTIGGLDPQTPASREALAQLVRHEVKHFRLTARDRVMLGGALALLAITLLGRITGAIS